MKKNQKGFGIVGILAIIVFVGLIGTIGWMVYDKQMKPTKSGDQSSQAEQNKTQETDDKLVAPQAYVPELPSGWIKKSSTDTAVEFASPSGWGNEVTVQKFVLADNIRVGFGAPVWVRFAQSASIWQTIDADNNGNPGAVRAENLVKVSDIKAENKYVTATYMVGDGGSAQIRVLVAYKDNSFQFSLPKTCEEVICEGDKKTTYDEISAAVPQFIKTMLFK